MNQIIKALVETLNAYEKAFCEAGDEQIMAEIEGGRWNGAREILEVNRQLVEDAGFDWKTGEPLEVKA